ncbi:hypothetical protein, partial [Actinobacillus pleuropneumoniae]
AKYYAMRSKIARAKLKRVNVRIEALTHQKEKDKLDLLVEASLHALAPLASAMSTIFEDPKLSFLLWAFSVIFR